MKVLILADGRAVHTHRYKAELIRQGVDVVLASLERGDCVDILLKKQSVSNSLNYFFVNRQIKKLAARVNPHIVNPHFASGYGFSVAVSRVWKRFSTVLHCLGSDILISPKKSIAHRKRVIYALSRAKLIFADSEYLADNIRKLYEMALTNVIPWGPENGIIEIYKDRRIPEMNRPLKVLIPRPHQKVYNNEFIVSALAEELKKGRLTLTFPNWGDLVDSFKHTVDKICPDASIDYYNFVSRDKFPAFLSGFDIYLSASRSDSSPASLLDAMAAGLIPVVADIEGVSEWIDDVNAFMFSPDDKDSLKKAFDRLLGGDISIESLLEGNHNKVKSVARFEQNIAETIKAMENIL
jgi:glycosyltransferase involved in cell wall biosynthesis